MDKSLICFSLFSFGILFISTASAEIDPDTIVGMWLFDEGKGNVATDEGQVLGHFANWLSARMAFSNQQRGFSVNQKPLY